MKGITAIIPTRNEAHNIIEAIESVNFADEIMIVDCPGFNDTSGVSKDLAISIGLHDILNNSNSILIV